MLEEKKISELYQRHHRELFAYLLRFTSSRETAEDLLHDTFAALIDYSRKRGIDERTIRAFLYKTAHNLAINFMKRNRRITVKEKIDDTAAMSSPEEDAMAELLQAEIYRLLDTLDEVDRSIFIMKKELSMSTMEIAEAVGKSDRTVRRSLEKTLRIMADELTKNGFFPSSTISLTVLLLSSVLLNEEEGSP